MTSSGSSFIRTDRCLEAVIQYMVSASGSFPDNEKSRMDKRFK